MSENGGKPSIRRLKTRPRDRNWAMTRMGLSAGAHFAAHSVGNFFRSGSDRDERNRQFYQQQAQFLAEQLGELKGSVMKAGQMLSLYGQYFLPPEAVDVLSGLQDDTTPVDWSFLQPVIEDQLSAARRAELEIDERPIAAASLGQAHRARRKSDGLELVIKIQYPGVADAIDSDVKTIVRLLWLSKMVPRELSLDPVIAEVRDMLRREVDYEHEARATQAFAAKLADDPRFVVPRILPEYSGRSVLTMTYEQGVALRSEQVRNLPQTQRAELGRSFIWLFLREFFDWKMVQTDAHFGNYRVRLSEGQAPQLVLLDFGATRHFSSAFVAGYREVVAGAVERDQQRLVAGAESIGLMSSGFPAETLKAFAELCYTIVEPFMIGTDHPPPAALVGDLGYRYGQTDLPRRVTQLMSRAALSRYFRIPPREIVFLHRRMAGAFIAQTVLDVEWDARELVLDALGAAADEAT